MPKKRAGQENKNISCTGICGDLLGGTYQEGYIAGVRDNHLCWMKEIS
jgi:hypothetical protein